jgi:hypothetical protein
VIQTDSFGPTARLGPALSHPLIASACLSKVALDDLQITLGFMNEEQNWLFLTFWF